MHQDVASENRPPGGPHLTTHPALCLPARAEECDGTATCAAQSLRQSFAGRSAGCTPAQCGPCRDVREGRRWGSGAMRRAGSADVIYIQRLAHLGQKRYTGLAAAMACVTTPRLGVAMRPRDAARNLANSGEVGRTCRAIGGNGSRTRRPSNLFQTQSGADCGCMHLHMLVLCVLALVVLHPLLLDKEKDPPVDQFRADRVQYLAGRKRARENPRAFSGQRPNGAAPLPVHGRLHMGVQAAVKKESHCSIGGGRRSHPLPLPSHATARARAGLTRLRHRRVGHVVSSACRVLFRRWW